MNANILEVHEKYCWRVVQYDDGSASVNSMYMNRKNYFFGITEMTDIESLGIPQYVQGMLWESRQLYYDTCVA